MASNNQRILAMKSEKATVVSNKFMLQFSRPGIRDRLKSLAARLEAEKGVKISMATAAALAIEEADSRRKNCTT